MTHHFCLPKAQNFSFNSHYAVNLRKKNGELTPCGCPQTLLTESGVKNFMLDSGAILSVGDDMHTLYIDGNEIGSLGAAFGALLPGGIILTVNGDAEWIVGGKLCGSFKDDLNLRFSVQNGGEHQVKVDEIKFTGTYSRSSGVLTAKDCSTAAAALSKAMREMEQEATMSGRRVEPVWVAWQIKDHDSRVMARSQPQLMGDFQCLQGFTMPLTHQGDKISAMGVGVMTASPYSLHLSMERCNDDWKRSKAAVLEVYVSPQLSYMNGARGVFESVDSSHSVLMVSPLGSDSDNLEKVKAAAFESFGQQSSLCVRVNYPLEGFDVDIPVVPLSSEQRWNNQLAEPNALEALCAGSATFMADARNVGVLLTAYSSSPLAPVGSQKVSAGRILRIVTPAGGGGGWNYGRYHLLVFATDGIYAVSADRTLSVISSTLIHQTGIARADAVAVSADAIYCATSAGQLLKIKGSSISAIDLPFTPVAVCACGYELWILTSSGQTFTVNQAGEICMRSDCMVKSFSTDIHPLAVDSSGALRDLSHELPLPTRVEYYAPLPDALARHAMMEWHISSESVRDLHLSLISHSGAALLPVTTLTVSGQINAPITARIISPLRPYAAMTLCGTISPCTILKKLKITPQ